MLKKLKNTESAQLWTLRFYSAVQNVTSRSMQSDYKSKKAFLGQAAQNNNLSPANQIHLI